MTLLMKWIIPENSLRKTHQLNAIPNSANCLLALWKTILKNDGLRQWDDMMTGLYIIIYIIYIYISHKWNGKYISHIYPIYIPYISHIYIYPMRSIFNGHFRGMNRYISQLMEVIPFNGHKAIQLGGVSPEVYIGLKIDPKYMVGTSNLASWNGIPISDGWYMGRFSSYVAKCEGPRKLQGWTTDGW